MLYETTLHEVSTNANPGIEYEIALFYRFLLKTNIKEAKAIWDKIQLRSDKEKIKQIVGYSDISPFYEIAASRNWTLKDVSFETQNDRIGPADLVLKFMDFCDEMISIGLSVKYANKNTLNPTARRFITENQISNLQKQFDNIYIPAYIKEMKEKYGHISNWKRKRADAADMFYDLMRDAVIENWPNIPDKVSLLSAMFHSDSPIPFWVVNYSDNGYSIETKPTTVDESRVKDIVAEKYRDAFVAFKLDGVIIGKVQVKCNNGFIEDQFNHAGKAKKKDPDFIIDGQPRIKGKPFGSWDFTLGK